MKQNQIAQNTADIISQLPEQIDIECGNEYPYGLFIELNETEAIKIEVSGYLSAEYEEPVYDLKDIETYGIAADKEELKKEILNRLNLTGCYF